MRRTRSTLLLNLALLVAAVAAVPTYAATPIVSSLQTQAIVIEGRSFPAGELRLEAEQGAMLASISIDGRQVARVFRQVLDRVPDGASVGFAFRTDNQGRQRLVGIRWTSPDGQRIEERLFRVAAVASVTPNRVERASW